MEAVYECLFSGENLEQENYKLVFQIKLVKKILSNGIHCHLHLL